jgi:hypothetical protein
LEIDQFFPAALLSITAGRDETVAPAAARAFHSDLEEHYQQHPERLTPRRWPRSFVAETVIGKNETMVSFIMNLRPSVHFYVCT